MSPCPAALYIRLSREDGDREESDSVANQRKLLTEFLNRKEDLCLGDVYVDDGFTGTNFQRPAFRRMLEAIEEGRIRCVIVKDLSRFGRDYIDTGRYLERYFPKKGCGSSLSPTGSTAGKRTMICCCPSKISLTSNMPGIFPARSGRPSDKTESRGIYRSVSQLRLQEIRCGQEPAGDRPLPGGGGPEDFRTVSGRPGKTGDRRPSEPGRDLEPFRLQGLPGDAVRKPPLQRAVFLDLFYH